MLNKICLQICAILILSNVLCENPSDNAHTVPPAYFNAESASADGQETSGIFAEETWQKSGTDYSSSNPADFMNVDDPGILGKRFAHKPVSYTGKEKPNQPDEKEILSTDNQDRPESIETSVPDNNTDSGDKNEIPPGELVDKEGPVNRRTSIAIVWGLLALAAVAITVLIHLILSSFSKRTSGPSYETDSSVGRTIVLPNDTPFCKAVINGVTHILDSESVSVGSEDGNIIVLKDMPGVSARHCTISFDPKMGDFFVKDLKSSYGTFLATGMKLKPGFNYKIKSGDSVFLGSKNNRIQLISDMNMH